MRDVMARMHLMGEHTESLFVRGQGSWLWDADGHAYLDFDQGNGGNVLGHSPKLLLEALGRQGEMLINPGSHQCSRGQLKLAAKLCQATGSERAAFCSSPSHANRLAISLALQWAREHNPQADTLIVARGGMGGEALAGLASRVIEVPFNDLDALISAVDQRCAAVLLEPVLSQGLVPATLEYIQGAQRLCRDQAAALLLDETVTAIGRCGALLAEELYGVRADVVTVGCALAGGLPMAAVVVRGTLCEAQSTLNAGEFPGEALLTTAGVSVLRAVLEGDFLGQVREVADHVREGLATVARRHGHGPLRGQGLLLGLPLIGMPAPMVVRTAREQGLLIGCCASDCLSLSPALTVSHGNVEEMLRRLDRAFERANQLNEEAA